MLWEVRVWVPDEAIWILEYATYSEEKARKKYDQVKGGNNARLVYVVEQA